MENTGIWIFYCNPEYWDIDEFLDSKGNFTTWTITDWQKDLFKKGQIGVIRVGKDNRSKKQLKGKNKLESGIYGIVRIESEADFIPDSDGNLWLNPDEKEKKRLRVRIKVEKNLLARPILINELKEFEEVVQDTALIKGMPVSTWALSYQAFNKIEKFADSQLEIIELIKSETFFDLQSLRELELKYSNATPKAKDIVSKRIERGDIAKLVKKLNNYECQICKELQYAPHCFKKTNDEYYIETHHVIPVSELEQGSLGVLNLITVCPNHHRQLHFGNVAILENNGEYFKFKIDEKELKINKITSR